MLATSGYQPGPENNGEDFFYDSEPAALINVDSRTGPLNEAERERYNAEYGTSGRNIESGVPVNNIDLRLSKARIRKALGLPGKKPAE